MADEKKEAGPGEDDKSINDLLKEYADDVKDKDLDDFLKSSEEDDAFEAEGDDADETAGAEGAEPAPKKSGGFLTMLLIVVAFGAAGAGAYVYLNKDEGMTAIMGGFSGGQPDENLAMPAPESAPVLPPPANDSEPVTALPDQPMPIMNETPALDITPVPTADVTAAAPDAAPAAAPAPGADLLAVPVTDATSTPPAPEAPAQPAPSADASQAVDQWMSGASDGMAEVEAKLPEKPVAELNAKPVPAPASTKSEKKASEPAAPSTKKRAASPADEALPPPYVAIQAKKSGTAAASSAASGTKMAPVVDEGGAAGHRDLEGRTNKNVADVTKATGETAALVAKGGGVVELGTTVVIPQQGVPAPVGMLPRRQVPVPAMQTVPLAIKGGRSLPPGSSAYAQLPATDKGTQPAPAASEPVVPAVPVETVEQEAAAPAEAAPAPARSYTSMAAPVAPSSSAAASSQDARSVLAAAMEAEKAGQTGDALELYQRALELDAVYGDGRSIDRGMVYDRIGAIRAGSR